ncbi:GspE/PulE family protein [Psychroflexus tropicus]|uniref:GspE/PulE family protein n=1 Tax=Psychroflexus tropicus TaxID=197345 RepID=UPI0003661217|nr:GspE/PulE family protein [Psychroflexus tropicus]
MSIQLNYQLPTEFVQLITTEQAYAYRVVPVGLDDEVIKLLSDRSTEALKNELEVILNQSISFETVSTQELDKYLSYNFRKTKGEAVTAFNYSNDFIEKLLQTARNIGGSDIHFEPFEEKCRIRFRIDGKLKEHYIIPKEEYPVIVNKIKIKANLDISEKRLPQDGRITLKTELDEFDIRVSSLPTLHGEKIVLRILSKDTDDITLLDLGFTEHELKAYNQSIKKPNGIVLISGPTGSGKTTTLYASLKVLNDEKTNILTIEDPIEYTLEGINQVQLKENIGLDFASTLKTFLRQDPDIIMIGEIRDVSTANMAVRAALTGHLVLSTIHTNSAWATVSRLIDMGIPSFLIASTLNVTIAQRLVRVLCDECKEEHNVKSELFPDNYIVPRSLETHYIPIGCSSCYQTGYQGRKAIYEIIPIDKYLHRKIKENEMDIDSYIEEKKIKTLQNNAIRLVKDGVTSIEEIYPLLIS